MLEIRNAKDEYKGFRELWCRTFGDDPQDIQEMFDAFGSDIEAYVMVDDNGKKGAEHERTVVSALTLLRMGELKMPAVESSSEPSSASSSEKSSELASATSSGKAGKGIPCYVSYAICTDEKARGLGYGSTITEFARNEVHKRSAVSMLCPANAELIDFYKPLGYEAKFPAYEGCVDCLEPARTSTELARTTTEPARTSTERAQTSAVSELTLTSEERAQASQETAQASADSEGKALAIEQITAEEYNSAREKILANVAHVRLGSHALLYIEKTSREFISVDGGRLIAVVDRLSPHKLYLSEALASCELDSAEMEAVLSSVGTFYNKKQVIYRTKGDGYMQAMISVADGCDLGFEKGYFGFPFD